MNFNSEPIYSEKHLKAQEKEHRRRLSMFICANDIDWFNLW